MAATPANSLTLVSTGLADARLMSTKGNPDIHQFIHVVNKTTRWAAQWNKVYFDGTPEFGQRVSVTVPMIGELINGVMVVVEMPDIYTPQLLAIQVANGNTAIQTIDRRHLENVEKLKVAGNPLVRVGSHYMIVRQAQLKTQIADVFLKERTVEEIAIAERIARLLDRDEEFPIPTTHNF
jgi:hypothetical protein